MAQLNSQLRLTLLDQVSGPARRVSGAIAALNKQQTAMMAPLRSTIGQLALFGAGYVGVTQGVDSTIGAAIRFESAFADVRKVVDASDEQFENMARTIKSMSTELPMASTEIAALFAAAGESGVATSDLKAFAEMAARVGIAFDMPAAEAGGSLAKLKTQLGLTVAETGDLADAINELSNNMASKASDITRYMLRVGALAEMGGFSKEAIAGIGSAMIAAGAEAETAGTAMQNVVKAMTRGSSAKKAQREAAKALGLDLPLLAKEMQKDAPKALKKVLAAIAKQSKHRHISLLSDFFGDEAKAFAPLVGNIDLLDQALETVADRAKYSGSAFREFVSRAGTVENALSILRNKVSYLFEDMGQDMLPSLREGIAGIGYVIDTLGERASVFDKMGTAFQGFTQGLGYDGGVREAVEGLGDLLFGEVDGSGAADQLGRVFADFERYGKAIKQFGEDIKDNPIVKFFGDLSPYYLDALKWSIGFALVAGAIRKLAGAMMLLSGASTILAAIKGIGGVATALGVGGGAAVTAAATSGKGKGASFAGAAAKQGGSWLARWLGGKGVQDLVGSGRKSSALTAVEQLGKYTGKFGSALGWLGKGAGRLLGTPAIVAEVTYRALDAVPHATMESATRGNPDLLPNLDRERRQWEGTHFEGGRHRAGLGAGPMPGDKPVTLDAATISQLATPRGVQEVREVNRQPPEIHLSVTQNITGVSSPQEAADQAASRLGQAVKSAVESSYSD